MGSKSTANGHQPKSAQARQQRLAEALRANLGRRKAQHRARSADAVQEQADGETEAGMDTTPSKR